MMFVPCLVRMAISIRLQTRISESINMVKQSNAPFMIPVVMAIVEAAALEMRVYLDIFWTWNIGRCFGILVMLTRQMDLPASS
jgi:hypothetical protein